MENEQESIIIPTMRFQTNDDGITITVRRLYTSKAAGHSGQCLGRRVMRAVELGRRLSTLDGHRRPAVAVFVGRGRRRPTAGPAAMDRRRGGHNRCSAGSAAGSRSAAARRRRQGR